jgi:hypothetical protein
MHLTTHKMAHREANTTLKHKLLPLFLAVLLLALPSRSHSGTLQDTWYRFDRWAANFDPMGNALAPLNEIPGLKVSGLLYQWSFFNIHSDETIGLREKDWRVQQAQFLGEIHTRYQFSPRTALAAKIHYHYDGVYDSESSSLYADHPNAFRTASWDQFVREFYLDIEHGNWFMKFGKQQQAWGKMEGRWMDFINNIDGKDGPQVRSFFYNELRIPLWMSSITYAFGKSSVQLLWIPDFEPGLTSYPGSVWYSPLRTDPKASALYRGEAPEPGTDFKDHQWAIRFDTKIKRATWSVGYKYGFSSGQTRFIRLTNTGLPFYDPEYTRNHYIGSALDFAHVFTNVPMISRVPLVFRAEVVYKTHQYYLDAAKWDRANSILLSGDGYTKADTTSGAVQFRFFFPSRIFFTYQPMFSFIHGWHESMGTNRWTLGHLFLVGKWFESFENRLNLVMYTFLNTGGPVNEWQGTKTQLVLSYRFSDYIEGKLHYVDYSGSPRDYYGQYNLWDNVGWEVQYKF